MTSAEALDIIARMVFCYHDQFNEDLPEEDREWNKIEFKELCDKLIALLITNETPDVDDWYNDEVIQHEHKKFIDKIMVKVKTHSRLVSMGDDVRAVDHRDWHGDLRKETHTLIEDIENSLYRRLDEVGESK
jgi:hypothetical protein